MPFDGSPLRNLDRSGPAATMQNREQGTSLFSSRTQEVVGVVEGRKAINRFCPIGLPASLAGASIFEPPARGGFC